MSIKVNGLFCVLALSACASEPIIATPIEIKVPVEVSCKIQSVIAPNWPVDLLREGDDLEIKTRALIAEIYTRAAYEDSLLAAIIACQGS